MFSNRQARRRVVTVAVGVVALMLSSAAAQGETFSYTGKGGNIPDYDGTAGMIVSFIENWMEQKRMFFFSNVGAL